MGPSLPALLQHHAWAGGSPPAPCRPHIPTSSRPTAAGRPSGPRRSGAPRGERWVLGLQRPRCPPSPAALQPQAGGLSARRAAQRPLPRQAQGWLQPLRPVWDQFDAAARALPVLPALFSSSHASPAQLRSPEGGSGSAHLPPQGSCACQACQRPRREELVVPGMVLAMARISCARSRMARCRPASVTPICGTRGGVSSRSRKETDVPGVTLQTLGPRWQDPAMPGEAPPSRVKAR